MRPEPEGEDEGEVRTAPATAERLSCRSCRATVWLIFADRIVCQICRAAYSVTVTLAAK